MPKGIKNEANLVKPGMMFGKWKVLKFDYCKERQRPNIRGTIVTYKDNHWLCECQCENHTVFSVSERNLLSGRSTQCKKCVVASRKPSNRVYKFEDFTGRKIGYLEVVRRHAYTQEELDKMNYTKENVAWDCICHRCGRGIIPGTSMYVITSSHLRENIKKRPDTAACGCLNTERLANGEVHYKHGLSGTRLYSIFNGMKTRCYNPNSEAYQWYGAKGVTICQEWLDDFETFYNWAMENGYRDDLSIDRIDYNGNYEPSNCRWATDKEQANNMSTNHIVYLGGDRYTLSEAAAMSNVSYDTYKYRETFGTGAGWTENDKLFIPTLGKNETRESYREKMGICNPFVPAEMIMSDNEFETRLTPEQIKALLANAPLAKDVLK